MKKDWNYIASVEKAIAERYGKDTVQDFRSTWEPEKEKEYFTQLESKRKKRNTISSQKNKAKTIGDIVVRNPRKHKTENRTCPVCKTYSFSGADDLYMNRFEMCRQCYYDFAQGKEEKWQDGWRPTEEHIQSMILRRKK